MVDIVSRSEWGARAPRHRQTVSWSQRTGFAVHYTAGPPTQTPREIQDYHMDGNGWADGGYNIVVDRDGTAYEMRGWTVVGAHAAPYNSSHIGVAFIGSDGDATPAAQATIRALYDEACERAGRTLDAVGHRDLNQTSCPGDDLYAWVQSGMPASGGSTGGGDPLIGLSVGDSGEDVKALQGMILDAGGELPEYGMDSRYGDETAEALRQVRASVGSRAEPGWGDQVTGSAYRQLKRAHAREQARQVLAELGGSAEIPRDLDVRSLTAGELHVGGDS